VREIRHLGAFGAHHVIIAPLRNVMNPETAEATSIVLEGYKYRLIIDVSVYDSMVTTLFGRK
jgi:hypothetical protein